MVAGQCPRMRSDDAVLRRGGEGRFDRSKVNTVGCDGVVSTVYDLSTRRSC